MRHESSRDRHAYRNATGRSRWDILPPILRSCALGLVRHSTKADTEIECCENKSQSEPISESLWKDMIVGNKENEKKRKKKPHYNHVIMPSNHLRHVTLI